MNSLNEQQDCGCYAGCAICNEILKQEMLANGHKLCDGITKKGEPCQNWANDCRWH